MTIGQKEKLLRCGNTNSSKPRENQLGYSIHQEKECCQVCVTFAV